MSENDAEPAAATPAEDVADEATLDYLKDAYASTRDWYARAETKAQLLLGANGVFISILFSSIFGRTNDLHNIVRTFGPETWLFLTAGCLAIILAVCCAALTMWSLHGRTTESELKEELAAISSVDRKATYKPEALWYYGHLARLDRKTAIDSLRRTNRLTAIATFSYHLVTLSDRVLRKYRYLNLGWAWTATAFILIICGGASIIARS